MTWSVPSSEPMTESGLPTSVNRSDHIKRIGGVSPIAADGGFGPMDVDESEEETTGSDGDDLDEATEADADEGFGEDFDEFEAGAADEDFGDFDEGFQQPSIPDGDLDQTQPSTLPVHSPQPSISPYVSIRYSFTQYMTSMQRVTRNILELISFVKASPRFQRIGYLGRYYSSYESVFRRHVPHHQRRASPCSAAAFQPKLDFHRPKPFSLVPARCSSTLTTAKLGAVSHPPPLSCFSRCTGRS